jgi:membrane protein YqaA with SNARE-associated domain
VGFDLGIPPDGRHAAFAPHASHYCLAMTELAAYAGLFLAAFAAATIFPFQSEVVLVGLVLADDYSAVLLLAVASVGNTLGSVVNWGLGLGVERMKTWRWFPVSEAQLDRASGWYRRWGKWSLLLSWAPFIGDPLTVAAGVLREPFWSFLALVAIAKTARYAVLVAATLYGTG